MMSAAYSRCDLTATGVQGRKHAQLPGTRAGTTGTEGRIHTGSGGRDVPVFKAGSPGFTAVRYRGARQRSSGAQGRKVPGPKAEKMSKSEVILGTCAEVSIKQISKKLFNKQVDASI